MSGGKQDVLGVDIASWGYGERVCESYTSVSMNQRAEAASARAKVPDKASGSWCRCFFFRVVRDSVFASLEKLDREKVRARGQGSWGLGFWGLGFRV